jgi:hypothetical protein
MVSTKKNKRKTKKINFALGLSSPLKSTRGLVVKYTEAIKEKDRRDR